MGQYFLLVNLDKKEYVDPHKIGGLLKLWEWCVNRQANIIPWLLAKGPQDGTSLCRIQFRSEFKDEEDKKSYLNMIQEEAETPIGKGHFKTAGRWAGDRIILIGDYDESLLYDKVKEEYKEISDELKDEFNEFVEVESFKLGKQLEGIRPDLIVGVEGFKVNPKMKAKSDKQ